jgi:hypothetical protein
VESAFAGAGGRCGMGLLSLLVLWMGMEGRIRFLQWISLWNGSLQVWSCFFFESCIFLMDDVSFSLENLYFLFLRNLGRWLFPFLYSIRDYILTLAISKKESIEKRRESLQRHCSSSLV